MSNTSPKSWIVIAGGGTGGHLFPALAVADELRARHRELEISFYVTERPFDAEVLRPTVYEVVPQSVLPATRNPGRWWTFWRAWRHCCRSVTERFAARRPCVVLGAGGYAAGPPIHVAQRMGINTAILNPDAVPGRANRYLSRRARAVFAQWPGTERHFSRPEIVRTLGCPVRRAFLDSDQAEKTADQDRPEAVARFGLDANRKTLLITGASQGARTINLALLELRELVRTRPDWQLLHLTGDRDLEQVRQAYAQAGLPAVVLPFTAHMAGALRAADLVISRAGASTLAELTVVGRPSILLPYPYHRDQHQRRNAEVLAAAGAACVLTDGKDPRLNAAQMKPVLTELLNESTRRRQMSDAARRLGRPRAAVEIAEELDALGALCTTWRG